MKRTTNGSRCPAFRSTLAAIILITTVPAWAGIRGDRDRSLQPLQTVARHVLPRVDVDRLLAEDEASRHRKDLPLRVGHPMPVDLTPSNSGTWEDLPDRGRVWRLRIHSENARWIVLGFGTFRVDAGAELRIYDPGRVVELGPFGSRDVRGHGQLWLPPIESDTLVVELRQPESMRGTVPRVQVGTVAHGYKDAWGSDVSLPSDPVTDAGSPATAGSCNVDVRCPAGDAREDQIRGVVQLLYGGFAFCSGALVNTTANDCRPYVLTAAHCVDSMADAVSTTFRFEYERPLCESGTPPTHHTVTGSSLLATFAASDFTLLEIAGELPEGVEPFFSGWNRSSWPAQESWGIHHPSGDVKKINYNADPLTHGRASGWGMDHWRVTEWESGTTEPGSSGSPIFDEHGRIVGQLHGGLASCEDDSWDEYGKFHISWTGGGQPDSRLSDWLDPDGTGEVSIDGLSLAQCSTEETAPCSSSYDLVEVEGNGDSIPDPGELIGLMIEPCADAPDMTDVEIGGRSVKHERGPSRGTDARNARIDLRVSEDHPCGEPIELILGFSGATNRGSATVLEIPTGRTLVTEQFRDEIEAAGLPWTSLPSHGGWTLAGDRGAEGGGAWFVANTEHAREASLVLSLPAPVAPGAVLRFVHRFDTENVRDGGVLETSTDGGRSWHDAKDLMLEGGYNSGIGSRELSPLAGRPAWAGDSEGWQSVEVDLAPFRGADLSLRWRFASDGSIGDDGWLLDDVIVETISHACHVLPLQRKRGVDGPRTVRALAH